MGLENIKKVYKWVENETKGLQGEMGWQIESERSSKDWKRIFAPFVWFFAPFVEEIFDNILRGPLCFWRSKLEVEKYGFGGFGTIFWRSENFDLQY